MNHLLLNNIVDIDYLNNYTAIIGESPSKGARSPKLWNSVFEYSNIKCKMVPLDVDSSNIINLLNSLNEDKKFLGGAITIPYKDLVANWLGENITPEAKKIGAVNCLYRNSNGYLEGTNTDGEASLTTFVNRFGSIESKSVMILGLGGAGKAVASYFVNSAKSVILLSRANNGLQYSNKIQANWDSWDQISNYIDSVDIIINCTSIGFGSQKMNSPLSLDQISKLKKSVVVFDIIYQPIETKLLQLSKKNDLPVFNGLEMNLEQAVLAYQYTICPNIELAKIRQIMQKI